MSVLAALQALGSTSVFASRAFLPLFVVALVARFPEAISWLPFVPERPVALSEHLSWLVSDLGLLALALLTLVEIRLDRDAELRELVEEALPFVKGGAAVLLTFGLLDAEPAALLEELGRGASLGLALGPAGKLGLVLACAAAGLLTLALAVLVRSLRAQVSAADPAGSFGLAGLASRLTDLWAAGGILLALLAPLLALLLAGLFLGLAALAHRRLEARSERRRRPCPACAVAVRPEAARCPSCGARQLEGEEPSSRLWPDRWLAAFGPSRAARDGEGERGLELLAQGRCPACAERRAPGDLLAAMPHACGWPPPPQETTEVGASPAAPDPAAAAAPGAAWPEALDRHLGTRALRLAVACLLLGLVPILGAAAALALGRLRVALPYRRYLGLGGRLSARWLSRGLVLLLLLGSALPVVSALAAPGLVGVQLFGHRRAFRAMLAARRASGA